jgi:hypothetical protein
MLQTPVAGLLPLKAASVAALSPRRQCIPVSNGKGVCLFSLLLCQQAAPYCSGVSGLIFCVVGYRGIVHPPSDNEGTKRSWCEPE